MIIEFKAPKHEFLVNNFESLVKKYNKKGNRFAEEILGTINSLAAADCLSDVPNALRPHPLFGNYKGYFAVWVTKKERVIFRPTNTNDPDYRIDNFKTIRAIQIVEIFSDYH